MISRFSTIYTKSNTNKKSAGSQGLFIALDNEKTIRTKIQFSLSKVGRISYCRLDFFNESCNVCLTQFYLHVLEVNNKMAN